MSSLEFLLPHESCELAVRSWIEVKVLRQLALQGGVSGANVYFVDARILFPALHDEYPPKPIRFVIKFSSQQDFDREKERYDQLPQKLRELFVDFATKRELVDGKFFMIMPHLREHNTLGLIVNHSPRKLVTDALNRVWEALENIHTYRREGEGRDPSKIEKPDINKFLSLYLGDIHSSLQKADKLARFFPEIESASLKVNDEKINQPDLYLQKLWKMAGKIAPRFSMWTHGDCHSRNVMFRSRDGDVKFIDVDQLLYNGDYIYDLGTLIADIEIYNRVLQCRRPDFGLKKKAVNIYSYNLPKNRNSSHSVKYLTERLEIKANAIHDEQWRPRLDLAKARFLLNMFSKTIDYEKAFIVYSEGMKALKSATYSYIKASKTKRSLSEESQKNVEMRELGASS